MAGKTPFDAYRNFRDSLQKALSCVTEGRLTVSGISPSNVGEEYTASLHRGDPVTLRGPHQITFSASQRFRIVEAEGDRGPFNVQTISYFYEIATRAGEEVLVYHWTPETPHGRAYGHLHVGRVCIADASPLPGDRFHRLHIPTGRIPIESILRFLIEDLDVPVRRERSEDWRHILERNEQAFNEFRTRY